jgi:hypothetical protein
VVGCGWGYVKPWEHSLRDFIDRLSFVDRVVLLIFVVVAAFILMNLR